MRVIRLLAIAMLFSACTREPATDQQARSSDDQRVAATSGEKPSATTAANAAAARERADERKSVAADARAAAQGPVTQAAQRDNKNVPAAILEDFKERVDRYMDVRSRANKDAPPLKETEDPAKIKAAQDGRAAAIRALRADAKAGDIFTPEIRHTFRQLLAPDLEGEEGRDVKKVLKDDAPAPGAVAFTVNARYPESAPLPTVPATLLMKLPQLPKGLEYRIIGKDLVLLDSDANLIVDFMRNAIS